MLDMMWNMLYISHYHDLTSPQLTAVGPKAICVVTRYCMESAIMSALLFDGFSVGFACFKDETSATCNNVEQRTQIKPASNAPLILPAIETVNLEPVERPAGVFGYLRTAATTQAFHSDVNNHGWLIAVFMVFKACRGTPKSGHLQLECAKKSARFHYE